MLYSFIFSLLVGIISVIVNLSNTFTLFKNLSLNLCGSPKCIMLHSCNMKKVLQPSVKVVFGSEITHVEFEVIFFVIIVL